MKFKTDSHRFIVAILAVFMCVLCCFGMVSRQSQTVFVPIRHTKETLVIDAGHGGEDGGAVSITGTPESGINLAIALKMDQLMGLFGISPVLLRDTDTSLHDSSAQTLRQKKVSDLHHRVDIIEGIENATLISIHQNSYPSGKYHGAQVFYANGELSFPFAQRTQMLLKDNLDPTNQRVAKQIPDNVYLMNHISCRAILVECGFLTNAEEEVKLRTTEYQTKLAAVLTASWLQDQDTNEGDISKDESKDTVLLYRLWE